MYVNEKLKLNKFRTVKCATKKELFNLVGNVSQNINSFTGDEKAGMPQNTTEELAAAEAMLRKSVEEQSET